MDLAGLVAGELFGKRAEVEDRLVPRAEHDDHALGGLDQAAEDRIAPDPGQCQPPPLDQPFRPDPEGVRVDWLEDVINGALAEGFDGSLKRSEWAVTIITAESGARSRQSFGRKSRELPSGNRRSRTMTSISASEESVKASPIEPAVSTAW